MILEQFSHLVNALVFFNLYFRSAPFIYNVSRASLSQEWHCFFVHESEANFWFSRQHFVQLVNKSPGAP